MAAAVSSMPQLYHHLQVVQVIVHTLLSSFTAEAALVVSYDVRGNSDGNTSGLAASYAATGLTAGSITRGPGLAIYTMWNGYGERLGAVHWTDASSRDANDYLQFQVTVQAGYQATFSSLTYGMFYQDDDGQRAVRKWDLLYSLDGFSTPGTVLRAGDAVALRAWKDLSQDTFTADNLATIGTVLGGGTVTFRFYGYGRQGSNEELHGGLGNGIAGNAGGYGYRWSGTGSDVILSGTVVVPEPAHFALFGGLGLVLFGLHRRLGRRT
jgi:hypothetical protein